MSRVEENEKVRKDISEAMDDAMKAARKLFGNERATALNSAKMTMGVTYLEDISNSLAVIADGVTEEKTHSKSIALIEDKFMENSITEKEWDIWVYLKEKYILGKKVESSDDTWDLIQNLHVPVKGTNRICGFCKNSDFHYLDLDNAVCHCALHNIDVAFTCSACDSFDDVHSDMSFEEFAKRWESYFDKDEMRELKKAWLNELWLEGPKTLREKYGDIVE